MEKLWWMVEKKKKKKKGKRSSREIQVLLYAVGKARKRRIEKAVGPAKCETKADLDFGGGTFCY